MPLPKSTLYPRITHWIIENMPSSKGNILKTKKILSVLIASATVLFAAGCGQSASASTEFPTKDIELIVPYGPGGGNDLVARALATAMEEHLPEGVSVVIKNRDGANGAIGATELMQSKDNGYTLGILSTSVVGIQPLYGTTAYQLDNFTTLAKVSTAPQTLLVKEDSEFKSFEDWLSYVQENPNEFTYGVPAVGGVQHLDMELLNDAAGISTKHVPYESVNASRTAVLGGHVDAAVAPFTQADEGSLRPLFSFSGNRSASNPDLKSVSDFGYDVDLDTSHYIMAPAGLGDSERQALEDILEKASSDPTYVEQLKKMDFEQSFLPGEEAGAELAEVSGGLAEVVAKLGLTG